jgi:hypothetical protein
MLIDQVEKPSQAFLFRFFSAPQYSIPSSNAWGRTLLKWGSYDLPSEKVRQKILYGLF